MENVETSNNMDSKLKKGYEGLEQQKDKLKSKNSGKKIGKHKCENCGKYFEY